MESPLTSPPPPRGKIRPRILAVLVGLALLALAGLGLLHGARDSNTPGKAGPPPGPVAEGESGEGARHRGGAAHLGTLDKDALWVLPGGGRPDKGPDPEGKTADALGNLGYLAGYRSMPPRSGVLVHDRDQSLEGVNLCVSAHKASAELVDMEGKVLHEWAYDFDDLPEPLRQRTRNVSEPAFFREAHVFKNGDLITMYEYRGLIKLDRFSRLIWYVPNGAHHDVQVMPDGKLLVLLCELHPAPRENPNPAVVEDFIAVLDPDGNELARVSIAECFGNSKYAGILRDRLKTSFDLFHANKIQVLDGAWEKENPAFRKGNILVSLRRISAVAVVDMENRTIPWLLTGTWKHQHESRLLDNGHLILLDNLGYFGCSRVMEVDPMTGEEFWEYHGDPPESIRSLASGDLQRLENGNTLITDTFAARAFEVTPEKQVVWEYVNPHRVLRSSLGEAPGLPPDDGTDAWLVAALLQVTRLPKDFPLDWIPREGRD